MFAAELEDALADGEVLIADGTLGLVRHVLRRQPRIARLIGVLYSFTFLNSDPHAEGEAIVRCPAMWHVAVPISLEVSFKT